MALLPEASCGLAPGRRSLPAQQVLGGRREALGLEAGGRRIAPSRTWRRQERGQVMTQEVADPVDRQIRRTIRLRVASVLTLPGKDRRDALTPGFLDRGQDPRLVVHQDVVLRRVAPLDVTQRAEPLQDVERPGV